ncbi:hypothetical protein AVEN_133732-1 [Araneus ventricosus]|uniref:TPM domain-containing protein n=1 Tax=Araneus ventricosus TaxID=182803 RepID=A0A4Y2B6W9_ARAVE|nr:hypothetical protein AVEN_133732-1 [Araneus ventricosus]
MKLFITCGLFILYASSSAGQRYAERNPLPVDTIPIDENYYDEDYLEGYDFYENKDIYRWNVDKFPHPQEMYKFCNRLKPSYVCDPDQVLEKEEADKLDTFIKQLYRETPCICDDCSNETGGIIVGIALLKYMFQPYNQHPAKTIRTFAQTLRENWNLGKCDNDILIVVATTDRLSFTDVGKETSYYVSLNEAHRIFLENKANFTAGHFYEGLRAMLSDYYAKTRTMKKLQKNEEKLNLGLIAGSIIGAVVVLGILLFLIFLLYRYLKRSKDPQNSVEKPDGKSEGVSSSWTKQDIKVMFGSLKSSDKPPSSSTKYQPCRTEEKDLPANDFRIDEDEIINTTLAVSSTSTTSPSPNSTQATTTTTVDNDTSTTELLDKELTDAVEGLTTTFKPKKEYRRHETNL